MLKFLTRRLSYGILVMALVVLIITSIIYLAPVDPTRLTFGQRSDNKTMALKRKEFGLDQPLSVQLGLYLRDLCPIDIRTLDSATQAKYSYIQLLPVGGAKHLILKMPYLRESYQTGRPVADLLRGAIAQTAVLALFAMVIATFLGVTLGVITSLRPHAWFDELAMGISVLGYSLPSYVVAMFVALIFGYWLSDWTGLHVQGSLFELDDFGDERTVWANVWLPAFALGIRPVALIMQLTRATMLDILTQDYIRTARAKGLSERVVILQHALRNALTPIATATTGWLAGLLAGAFFVESVFSYNGLGQVTVNALLNFDIPVVCGAILFTSGMFVILNILSDVLYAVLDPRVKLH